MPPELDQKILDQLDAIVADEAKPSEPKHSQKLLTLSDVLAAVRTGDTEPRNIQLMLSPLWQCLANLREGVDHQWLPRLDKFRRTSKKLNWYNLAEEQVVYVRTITGLPAKRTSRAQAWRDVSAALKSSCNWQDPSSIQVASGGIVLVTSSHKRLEWKVAIIHSVWSFTAKKKQREQALSSAASPFLWMFVDT